MRCNTQAPGLETCKLTNGAEGGREQKYTSPATLTEDSAPIVEQPAVELSTKWLNLNNVGREERHREGWTIQDTKAQDQ